MSGLPNLSRAVGHWPVPLEPTDYADYADKVQEQGGHVVWLWVSSKATSHQSAGPLLNVWHFSTVAAQAHRSHQQVQSIVTHRDRNCTVPRAPGPRMFPGRRSVPSTGLGTGGGRPCCYRAPVRSLSTPAGSTGPLDDQPCGGHALILKQQQRLSQHSSFLEQLQAQTRALGGGCHPATDRDSEMPPDTTAWEASRDQSQRKPRMGGSGSVSINDLQQRDMEPTLTCRK